jgi:hypothetical protein
MADMAREPLGVVREGAEGPSRQFGWRAGGTCTARARGSTRWHATVT